MARRRASDVARRILSTASRHLLTPDPADLPEIGSALDHSLDWTLDRHALAKSHRDPFEPTFSESRANALAFQVEPGDDHASAADRAQMSTQAMRSIIAADMGPDAAYWFDQRTEPLRAANMRWSGGFGANFTTAVDRSGVVEAAATYGWPADVTNQFPDSVIDMANTAVATLPGLRPFFTTIRCGRSAGGQQITFDMTTDTTFDALKPLMEAFGLGARHAGLTTLGAFALGARYALPARSSTLTLLRAGTDVEMRLDINLDALPDAPPVLLPLLRLPMQERPAALDSFDRWLTAMTPEGYTGPGSVTVLSIRVRRDMPARLAVFLRPIAFEPEATPLDPSATSEEFTAHQMPDWRVA
ncbi:MAG: hypothetical protein QNJ03_13110 [Dinoroseobacter sp.]|nr:hypothetical protein [Dinoroseobacter sp.]